MAESKKDGVVMAFVKAGAERESRSSQPKLFVEVRHHSKIEIPL